MVFGKTWQRSRYWDLSCNRPRLIHAHCDAREKWSPVLRQSELHSDSPARISEGKVRELDIDDNHPRVRDRFVSVKNVTIAYGGREILDQTSFVLSAGELVCLLGPSGCGKTSLLRFVSGLEPPQRGFIEVGGRPAQAALADGLVSISFQEPNLLPWLSWRDNAGWYAKMRTGRLPAEEIADLASAFGLAELPANTRPAALSGGQRQRVALIRALTMHAPFLILDEPFAALDYTRRKEIITAVRQRLLNTNTTTILVTHDVRDAVHFVDRLIMYREQDRSFTREFRIDLPRDRPASIRDSANFNRAAAHAHEVLDGSRR